MEYKKDGIVLDDGTFLALSDIINKCNNIKTDESDLVILQFYWTRRQSDIFESRVYPRQTAERISEMMLDKQIYFGEIEGKHSEVYGVLEDDEITIVDDKVKVTEFLSAYPDGQNYNHSFLDSFCDAMYDEESDEFIEEFKELAGYTI